MLRLLNDILDAPLNHCCHYRQDIRIDNLASFEYIQKIEEAEGPAEVNFRDVVSEEDAEANRPERRDVPPPLEAVCHNDKTASFPREFGRVALAVADKKPGKDFAPMCNNLCILVRKEVQQPL
jgi:hypothetical protein